MATTRAHRPCGPSVAVRTLLSPIDPTIQTPDVVFSNPFGSNMTDQNQRAGKVARAGRTCPPARFYTVLVVNEPPVGLCPPQSEVTEHLAPPPNSIPSTKSHGDYFPDTTGSRGFAHASTRSRIGTGTRMQTAGPRRPNSRGPSERDSSAATARTLSAYSVSAIELAPTPDHQCSPVEPQSGPPPQASQNDLSVVSCSSESGERADRVGCRGQLVSGSRNWMQAAVSVACALGVPAGCLLCNISWLVAPERGRAGKVVLALYCYLLGIMYSSMFVTAFSDPGIMPKSLDSDEPELYWTDEDGADDARSAVLKDKHMGVARAKVRWVNVGHYLVLTHWCPWCETYRPLPRTTHCRLCDACVEQTDHHCTFLNNCIGRRNYFPFIVFLLAASLGAISTIAIAVVHVVEQRKQSTQPVVVGNYVLMGVTFLLASPVVGLLIFHLGLISRGVTTIENFRSLTILDGTGSEHEAEDQGQVYSLGSCYLNWLYIICRPGVGIS